METPQEFLRLESRRGSVVPLWVESQTATGKIWGEAREIPRGGLLRYTRFRVLFPWSDPPASGIYPIASGGLKGGRMIFSVCRDL
jgi:hypothetical protein